jgi:LysR family glycine cleavage system transcriptional activator
MLKVFVVVCRVGSMKLAADVMCVTPGAVSHHVKSLEELLGSKLLIRRKGLLELTPFGAHAFELMAESFDRIEHNFAALTRSSQDPTNLERLTITTTGSFAAGWLLPHIGSFLHDNPDIDFRLESTNDLVNVASETRIDLALRHGLGHYGDLYSRMLVAPRVFPAISPKLLDGRIIGTIEELLAFPLLHDINRSDWPLWLDASRVADQHIHQGMAFADGSLLVQAAVAGYGIALVEDVHMEAELMSGQLTKAMDLPIVRTLAYYLVARPASLRKQSVRRFVSWIVAELDRTRSTITDDSRLHSFSDSGAPTIAGHLDLPLIESENTLHKATRQIANGSRVIGPTGIGMVSSIRRDIESSGGDRSLSRTSRS